MAFRMADLNPAKPASFSCTMAPPVGGQDNPILASGADNQCHNHLQHSCGSERQSCLSGYTATSVLPRIILVDLMWSPHSIEIPVSPTRTMAGIPPSSMSANA